MIFALGFGPLLRIVRQNIRRNAKHFLLSVFGIVVGTASFAFFLALSGGVRKVVLGDIFPIDRVEVIAPKATFTGVPRTLDNSLVDKIRARPGVSGVYPKMKLGFPSRGSGKLFGAELYFPLGGFMDGIDPALVAGDKGTAAFRDWEAEVGVGGVCFPGIRPPAFIAPTEAARLQAALAALVGATDDVKRTVRAALGFGEECSNLRAEGCPADHYCGWDWRCRRRVPVLLSRAILELYNGSFAPSHGLKPIGTVEQALAERFMKVLKLDILLGRAPMSGIKVELEQDRIDCAQGQLIGISQKAIPIGVTVPIGYIRRWNEAFAGQLVASRYSSIVVDVREKEDVPAFVEWVRDEGFEQEDSYAEELSSAIFIITLLFLVISFIIIGISAVNIAHTFFMLISERRREIGILRAIGATRADVRRIILGEAAVIGFVGGVLGLGLGVGAARLVDLISSRFVRDFPFKPATYFDFTPRLIGGAIAFAVFFCVLGALVPARRAAAMPPAHALAG